MTRIAIVGAGFSGTMLAVHLLQRCPAGTAISLIERNANFGSGMAYATGNANHLLNVPAGKMSAFPDRPCDFLDWLAARHGPGGDDAPIRADQFVSRGLFGSYMSDLLLRERASDSAANTLTLVSADVARVEERDAAIELFLGSGRKLEMDLVVLALGNFPPAPPQLRDDSFLDGPCYRPDPWSPDALAGLDINASILLLGTGLTAMDMIIALLDRGHAGPNHVLSRRGLLPHAHPDAAAPKPVIPNRPLPTEIALLCRTIRRECEAAVADGASWYPVIDRLRPFTGDIWASLSTTEKRRFLRHLRPWWDCVRHRMAPEIAARIGASIASGQVSVHRGRLQALEGCVTGITARYARRGTGEIGELSVERVINATGTGADYARTADPLIRGLLTSGLARPDPLSLGLDVTRNCAVRKTDGAISRRLFAIGPVTKGTFWEMVAVPDIRRQADLLSRHLASVAAL